MKDIEVGTEITFDYAMSECIEGLGGNCDWDCLCGAKTCRGRFTGADWRIPELWERYGSYFSPYILKKINHLKAAMGLQASTSTAPIEFPCIEKCLLEVAEREAKQQKAQQQATQQVI